MINYDAYKTDGPDPLNTNSCMDFLAQQQDQRHQDTVGAVRAAAVGVAVGAAVNHATRPTQQVPQVPAYTWPYGILSEQDAQAAQAYPAVYQQYLVNERNAEQARVNAQYAPKRGLLARVAAALFTPTG
jgi:hypothetical protein